MRYYACLAIALRLGRAVLLAGSLIWSLPSGLAAEGGRGASLAAFFPTPSLDEGFREPLVNDSQPSNDVNSRQAGNPNEPNSPDDSNNDQKQPQESDCKRFTVHGQTTIVTDRHAPFRSPYIGPNSLLPIFEDPTSQTSTLFLGTRLWDNAELYFNPEVAGGRGFSNVLGIAGFPNGEITRVGKPQPTPYIARLYFAKTLGLGGEQEKAPDDFNQVAGYRDISRLTVRVGKMAFTDAFDNNAYSHDPRTQFQNWALMYNGAWDFAANVRGYSYGGVVDLNQANWALRYGLFAEPRVANGPDLDPKFGRAHGQALELENRYRLFDRPGTLRSMVYLNNAHMGNYREATDNPAFGLDITKTRRYSTKFGFAISLEQQLSDDLGLFMRWGWNDGRNETWAFTEIDRTVAIGLLLRGSAWSRPQDQVGTAMAINGISRDHRDYLAAGGVGFIIGDGRLNYGTEDVFESYYRWQINKHLYVSGDLQFVVNPAYNRDRGPVSVEAIRVHAEF
ncbi:MAG: carbohydrate porin [Planctomycetia bacterium]|nr:carbohydrate porin [Planctomycetia bacterium]